MGNKCFKRIIAIVMIMSTLLLVSCGGATSGTKESEASDDLLGLFSSGKESSTEVTSEDVSEDISTDTESSDSGLTKIDPFDGIKFEVTGISPFCKIAINNASCSNAAQGLVKYTLDKEEYANGETVVVTASFIHNESQYDYELTETEYTYTVENQPEYITSVDGLDLTTLEKEMDDYISANSASAIGTSDLFGVYVNWFYYDSVDEVTEKQVHLSSLKKNKELKSGSYYNSLMYVYSMKTTIKGNYSNETKSHTIYVNVIAPNVVKYPNGELKWGTKDIDACDFTYKASDKGVNDIVTTTITVLAADYNLEKISG